ncbi:hypothetical protein GCM10010274_24460 [Streptomyces lavendofoliae]|uniref:Uncharacterized protein n=1 Tax=Streptomyces lavendofoliae TaxID=67314 RepID=A0A918HW39_9ACTN|nr:hypothetical protein GCM10010274_24460 [Streptomyces lavendofoliae]
MGDEEDEPRRAEADDGAAVRTMTLHAPQDAPTGTIGSARPPPRPRTAPRPGPPQPTAAPPTPRPTAAGGPQDAERVGAAESGRSLSCSVHA